MRIVVTGSCGFVASHVLPLLGGHRVVGVDSLDERVHPTVEMPAWTPDHTIVVCDYADTQAAYEGADAVIHLAAQVSVADSMVDPLRYVEQNTLGTARMLENLPSTVTRLIVASSMSVYGEGGTQIAEEAPVKPASIYGLTKYDQEQLCLLWGLRNNIPVTALRFFNIYGPNQSLTNSYTGVLANFATRLLNNEQPLVFEDGQQTRDFIAVEDVARAVAMCALQPVPSHGVFNVCTGEATSILQAAWHLAQALGKKDLVPHVTNEYRKGDIRHCTGNPSKIKGAIGWEPRVPFSEGIKLYGKWLLNQ